MNILGKLFSPVETLLDNLPPGQDKTEEVSTTVYTEYTTQATQAGQDQLTQLAREDEEGSMFDLANNAASRTAEFVAQLGDAAPDDALRDASDSRPDAEGERCADEPGAPPAIAWPPRPPAPRWV